MSALQQPTLALHAQDIAELVASALAEDSPTGDITSETFLSPGAHAEAALVARESGVFSGGTVFEHTMTLLGGPHSQPVRVDVHVAEGAAFAAGDILATASGDARLILRAERVALNLIQRMCGIATATRAYVAEVAGTKARVVDTRKTTPGLRVVERYAVRCGGGHNHRFGLSDAVLVKDNHMALIPDIQAAVQHARRSLPHTTHIEVEVDRIEQIPALLEVGVDTIMADNFSLADLEEAVELIAGRAVVEASGGITVDSIGAVARTGVDLISVGALTHSATALDLGLDFGKDFRKDLGVDRGFNFAADTAVNPETQSTQDADAVSAHHS